MNGCNYSIDVIDIEQEDNTIETEEQFLLEPGHTKNGDRYVMVNIRLDYQYRSKDLNMLCLYDFVSHFHKKVIDRVARRLLKNTIGDEGERLKAIPSSKTDLRSSTVNLHEIFSVCWDRSEETMVKFSVLYTVV